MLIEDSNKDYSFQRASASPFHKKGQEAFDSDRRREKNDGSTRTNQVLRSKLETYDLVSRTNSLQASFQA